MWSREYSGPVLMSEESTFALLLAPYPSGANDAARPEVGRCRLTVSKPVSKAPMVSVLEARTSA
jgi:hypothetical protein